MSSVTIYTDPPDLNIAMNRFAKVGSPVIKILVREKNGPGDQFSSDSPTKLAVFNEGFIS